jgi:predicted nucleotidyltransferase
MSDFLDRVFRALNASGVPYIVTGAEAVAVYGRLRTTRDCDVIAKEASSSLIEALKNHGFSAEKLVRGHNSIFDTKSNRYIDLLIDPDEDFNRYRNVEFKAIQVRFRTPEDLILKKLEFSRGEASGTDVDDIVSIMIKQRNRIDIDYLTKESRKVGTYELLQDIVKRIERGSE